ncbi:MAG: DNA-directed RNA polymerase subunit omega [Armatimonadetes bacterium]|nr:DNA-directed RNA polymerase subunit omega [Armatimonadota bacterium]
MSINNYKDYGWEYLLDKISNKFFLVNLIFKRIKQKISSISLEEKISNNIIYKVVKEIEDGKINFKIKTLPKLISPMDRIETLREFKFSESPKESKIKRKIPLKGRK